MKDKRTVEVYTCDAPGCRNIEHYSGTPNEDLPLGYHGQVTEIGEWGAKGADWYACKPAHIKAAVLAALGKNEE